MVEIDRAVRQLERALWDEAVRRGNRSDPPIHPGEGAVLIATIVYCHDGTERVYSPNSQTGR